MVEVAIRRIVGRHGPGWTPAGPVGVACNKDEQRTDRPPRPAFNHRGDGLTAAAGRLPSATRLLLLCCAALDPHGPAPAHPSRPQHGPPAVMGHRPAPSLASWRASQRVNTHCCTRRSRGWPARSAPISSSSRNHMTYLTRTRKGSRRPAPLRKRSAEPDTRPGINRPPGPASRSPIASTTKAGQASPPGS